MSEGIDDPDAALHSLEAGQTWITNADTKIGLATAALALLTSAFISRLETVGEALAENAALGIVLLSGAVAVGGLLAWAGWHLLQGLLPAMGAERHNRFAWPSVKELTDDSISRSLPSETLRLQAWEQARCLSSIAERKYQRFHDGATRLAAAFVALAIWAIGGLAALSAVATGG